MYPFYANGPSPACAPYYQSQSVGTVQYPHADSYAVVVPHDRSLYNFYDVIKERYTDNDRKLRHTISRSWFPSPETKQQCSDFVLHLRIHRNLFMHTYVHLVVCCKSGHLHRLVDNANRWKEWGSIQQLAHHRTIKNKLINFWMDRCPRHASLFNDRFAISDDDSDLLCHLLYCGTKPELYKLSKENAIRESDHYFKASEQVIELLWQFLMKPQASDVTRRLRAHIYRMARKSAYIPHDLQIGHPSISHRQNLGAGANGMVTKATMNGRDVVIKEISCGDRATQRKCLEMFAGEAILWRTLQHKNIVPFLGVIVQGSLNIGLVSPFFKNGNIRHHMKRYISQDWPVLARRWARDLAQALEYVHSHEPPIVHGDLKGDNVLVDDTGYALLCDFGQSYASDSGKYLDSTRVGLPAYNPFHWMAPELMLGDDHVKASDKSDIYSFGCVLYEMVSGRIPFEGLEPGSVIKYVQNGGRPNNPGTISSNDPLWRTAKLCWKHCPEDRPSAAALVSCLR